MVHKLIINPAYKIIRGVPACKHNRLKIKHGNLILEFCDECMICYVREMG